jgi:hypothetical protein
MDRQQIGLKLTLDALGLPARLDTFADRLILQKAIYLAQVAGVQLGYHFHWYLRGPYSPGLTRDAFAVVAAVHQGLNESEGWNLDPASTERLQRLRPLLLGAPRDERATRLELLASVHFLLQAHPGQANDTAQLRATLRRYGKDFSEGQIRQACEELTRHGLGPGPAAR